MKREQHLANQEKQFRNLAELAWTRNTIYPRDQYAPWQPTGQCGITNFGLGVWLVWRGLAHPKRTFYAEGRVRRPTGEVIDDKHAWVLIGKRASKELRHTDLTLDQYEDFTQRVVTGKVKQLPHRTVPFYTAEVASRTRVTYEPEKVTPLAEYDTSRFGGRLDRFLGSCYHSTQFMGQQAIKSTIEKLWLPVDSAQNDTARRNMLLATPCDAQRFSSV